ncbi:MAG: S-layer homology domain-containing protein [Oscillospiraceae bacterium]|nr:S-layer homology domain-containing protein [Oscillospiraceae bacterium]
MKTVFRCCGLLLLWGLLCLPALGAQGEILSGEVYCFSREEFSLESGGILIRQVPDPNVAVIRLGNRKICAGDVLDVTRLQELSLHPVCKDNAEAVLRYLPILDNGLGQETEVVVCIRSGKNEAPKAEGLSMETYKNIANNGKLSGTDPEGENLEFALAEGPKKGKVELKSDGTFLYIPGKNKVGEDGFTFTVKDEAGNVSEPAKVKIRILKPSKSASYADMAEDPNYFEALWAKEQGLMGAVELAGKQCFCPRQTVSRGDFLVMLMELTDQPIEESLKTSAFTDVQDCPVWMQVYFANAMRKGIVRGEVGEPGMVFRPNDPITGREAAVMVQNVLRLPVSVSAEESAEPAWAATSVQALQEAGMNIGGKEAMNREQVACLLYRIGKM